MEQQPAKPAHRGGAKRGRDDDPPGQCAIGGGFLNPAEPGVVGAWRVLEDVRTGSAGVMIWLYYGAIWAS